MSLEALLTPLETTDATLLQIRDEAARMLFASPTVVGMSDFAVYIVARFERLGPKDRKRLETDAAMALADEKAIIVNERFLHEAEIAVRAFGLAGTVFETPYLRSDEYIFDFVRRMTDHRERYLAYLRELADPEAERRVVREAAMALVFFLAHELGHLEQGEDARPFGTFIRPDTPLETSLALATLKFAAHDKELSAAGFTLGKKPPNEAPEIAAAAQRVIAELPPNDVFNQSVWFQRETAADEFATKILLECVASAPLPADDATPGYILAMRGLFAVSIASWHKDLLTFIEELAGTDIRPGAVALQASMVQGRDQYIRASSLFGATHRFTLLRAVLAMEQILRPHEGDGDKPPGHADAVHRYGLLAILMDTAVKLAFLGSATRWMLQKDDERGTPQLFMMKFFNLAEELASLAKKVRE
jgi:hypothetical protein